MTLADKLKKAEIRLYQQQTCIIYLLVEIEMSSTNIRRLSHAISEASAAGLKED
jgi:hypothetical protein